MTKPALLVTGASGQLGRRVVELLLEKGATSIIAATRDPEKLSPLARKGAIARKADFDDPASLEKAFHGADRLLLISTDAIGRRVGQHKNAIDAAKKAGVKHIVYTSLINPENSPAVFAPEHIVTEKMLKDSGIGHTILRNNIYTDMLLMKLPHVISSGTLGALAGNGGVGYVTREDCARAAAAALSASGNESLTYEITGPAVVTYTDLAAIASAIGGKPVAYVAVAPEILRKAFSPAYAELLVSLEYTIAQGKLAVSTNDVKKLTGRDPQAAADFLAQHRAALLEAPQKKAVS
ncbi:MAG: SDR family oxidoreductase [Alphaproteobacteria bacterium]|nr:MAG: SDR family oxidoreductase [Alphaproteobacteria bacterium]